MNATKSMNATKPINHNRNVPFITTCMGKALHDFALCMLSTTHTHHTKLNVNSISSRLMQLICGCGIMYHAIQTRSWGEKPAKRRFGRLFTTKELYRVVQETRGSIIGIYASLITIPVHVHVVHFSEVTVPKASALIRLTVAWLDV